MKILIAKTMIKIALRVAPLTKCSHKEIEPLMNNWVDKLNKHYYGEE